MSLQGYATTVNQTNDVVCAYAAAPYQPAPAVSDAPWVVLGSFTVPENVSARLCVAGLNSGPAVLSVALYAPGLVAQSAVAVSSATDAEALSRPLDLAPNMNYQIAAQYLGASGVGVVRTVSLRAP
jgi:hypothetical protein